MNIMRPNILIVDDEKNTREGLKKGLNNNNNYNIMLAGGGEAALGIASRRPIDVVLTDLKMPGMDGIALMKKIKAISPETMIIILTAYGTVERAVGAMKQGAYDFVTKPVNLDEIDILIRRVLSTRKIEKENVLLHRQLEERYGFENIIGNSSRMKQIFELIRQVAPTRAPVLITGESGTGKELIAQAIHRNSSSRNGPFIDVHCAALSETLLESELFGHEKGSFTGAVGTKPGRFEMADKGSLFLDEVSEMSLATQVKLLRVLETQRFQRVGGTEYLQVDIRVIGASNASLEQKIKEGKFRDDLYYRLKVVSIKLPPLRERKEDIPLLINYFLCQFKREHKKNKIIITPACMRKLVDYRWPGNVRELKNLIESMVITGRGKEIRPDDLPEYIRGGKDSVLIREPENLKSMEKRVTEEALKKSKGNRTKAAKLIGVSRRTLHRKIKEYGIE